MTETWEPMDMLLERFIKSDDPRRHLKRVIRKRIVVGFFVGFFEGVGCLLLSLYMGVFSLPW